MARLVLALLVACSSTTDTDAGGATPVDARQDTVRDRSLYTQWGFVGAPSPDGLGYCWPYDHPTCNCFNNEGGFAENEEACSEGRQCDYEPDYFRERFDEHGCPYNEEILLDYEPRPCFER